MGGRTEQFRQKTSGLRPGVQGQRGRMHLRSFPRIPRLLQDAASSTDGVFISKLVVPARLTSFLHICINDGMVKTQILLPDELYRGLKRLAEVQETSLAEIVRRAAEQWLGQHPSMEEKISEWNPPSPVVLGIFRSVPVSDWRLLAHEDSLKTAGSVRRSLRKHSR